MWMATTINKLQDVLFEIWLARNDALHNSKDSACNAKRHEELNNEIEKKLREKAERQATTTRRCIILQKQERRSEEI